MKQFILIIGSMFASGSCFSQSWNFAVETGVNIGGLPKRDWYADGKERIVPSITPVLGIHVERAIVAGFYLDVMTRYSKFGNQVLYHSRQYSTLHDYYVTKDVKEKQSYTRFSYGLGLGYRFKALKKEFNIVAGYRKTYHTAGNYYYKATSESPTYFYEFNKSFDPFSEPTLSLQAIRSGREIFFGAGMNLNRHFGVSLQYSVRQPQLQFNEALSGFFDSAPTSYHAYSPNDLTVSLNYRISK